MAVYVDPLMNHGWVLRGRAVASCHLFADAVDELHALASRIGLKRAWFQDHRLAHYDLTASRRELAIEAGAIPLGRAEAVAIWRRQRVGVR